MALILLDKMWTEYREWTATELELLKQNYRSISVLELATFVHRSKTAVEQKANQLGLRKTHTWTTEELELLQERYASANTDELKSLFQHPLGSVIKKAKQLELKRENIERPVWDDNELATLRELAMGGMSDQEIAQKLDRSIESTQRQRLRLSILLREFWSKTEDELLRRHYETRVTEDIATMLPGRTPNAIVKLGLRKPEVWSEKMEQLLKQKYATSTMRELLVIFPGKTRRQLKRRAQQLGLKKDLATLARCFNTVSGKMPKLPSSWTRWRNAVLRRDGFKCQECGFVKAKLLLEAHHIMPRRDPDCAKYNIDNGICLCADCHDGISGREYEVKDRYQTTVALNKEKF